MCIGCTETGQVIYAALTPRHPRRYGTCVCQGLSSYDTQNKYLSLYVKQKKGELLYWIKKKYPGHATGVLTEIPA